MDIISKKKKIPNPNNQWKIKPKYQKNYIRELLNTVLKKFQKKLLNSKIDRQIRYILDHILMLGRGKKKLCI